MDPLKNELRHHEGKSSQGSSAREPIDWRSYEFFSVDSIQTVRREDAIDVSAPHRSGSPDAWHLDLKVIQPLPTEVKASLPHDEPSICLGFSDELRGASKLRTSLSLVVATNSCRLIDSEVASIPLPRLSSMRHMRHQGGNAYNAPADVVEKLTLLRVAALRVSFFKDRELRPEHAVSLILNHVQRRTLEVARDLPQSPTLVVLRPEGSRVLTQREARQHFGFEVKSSRVEISAGPKTQTIVRGSDPIREHDAVRIKQNSLSGLINSVQIACCLMGIEPIPAASIEGCIPETSKQDKLNHLTTVPEKLRTAISHRQQAIRDVLSAYAPRSERPPGDVSGI